jgi:hypothetical protein
MKLITVDCWHSEQNDVEEEPRKAIVVAPDVERAEALCHEVGFARCAGEIVEDANDGGPARIRGFTGQKEAWRP